MNQAKLHVFISPDEIFPAEADMIVPYSFVKKWLMPMNAPHTLSCGSATTSVRLMASKKTSKIRSIRIRQSLAEVLGLYGSGRLNVRYSPRHHHLQIGPMLGILTNNINKHATSDDRRFGDMTRFFTECHLAAELRGIQVFLFAPDDLNVRAKQITGWTRIKGHWKQCRFPLPNVIYNRITSRRIEEQETLQQKLQWLQSRHRVQLFNERFLDKWQVHRTLWNDSAIRFMLPYTQLYIDLRQLKEMLKKFALIYIKPVNGSLGRGVMRLHLKGKHCHMQYTTLNGTITKSNVSYQEIAQQMARRIRHGRYLIQQGLPLITSLGRPVDFRALLQKNGSGKWSITSIVGRIAGDTHIVSNQAHGGTVAGVTRIIAQVDPLFPKPSTRLLRQRALQVAHSFERQIDGHFAELGIDLAVDMRGNVWLLEINSKPSKSDDAVTNPALAIRPSVHKTMDYTCYVTGYPQSLTQRDKKKRR